MREFKIFIRGLLVSCIFILYLSQPAQAKDELSILIENGSDFTDFPQPDGTVDSLFPTFCEGNVEDQGGTEFDSNIEFTSFSPDHLEATLDIELCDFCECAGLEGQAFEDCRNEQESCVAYRKVKAVFDAVPEIFQPDGTVFQTTITENSEPVLCQDVTNRFRDEICSQRGECCAPEDDGDIAPIALDYRCLTVINIELGLAVRTLAGTFIIRLTE